MKDVLARWGAAISGWLMRIGLGWATLALTAFAIVTSVLITGVGMHLTMPKVEYSDWIYFAIIAPAVGAPGMMYIVLSLAYRLKAADAELALLAQTDSLTGLGNRRKFAEARDRILSDAAQHGGAVSLLLVDVDNFKQVNDRLGHTMGDIVLAQVAACCAGALRAQDVACRWGGEEFCVLLPGAAEIEAMGIAEKLRRAVAELRIEGLACGVTVSVGVATGSGDDLSIDLLLSEADRQLYIAKNDGRNRVRFAFSGFKDLKDLEDRSGARLAG